MVYTPLGWKNLPDETTPITAVRLSHMETQYSEAVKDAKAYTDSKPSGGITSVNGKSGSTVTLTSADVGAASVADLNTVKNTLNTQSESFPVSFDLATTSAPTGDKLTIPTHISPSGGETTHPSVVYFPEGWNGYRYWMAHTPYPASNDTHEDPNICASQDGVKWVVPAGLTNPLDDAPGHPQYNSDTELVYAQGKLWCFWRYQDTNAGSASQNIYVRTSENGTTWTAKQLVQRSNLTTTQLNSPTLVFENGKWTMWAVDIAVTPNQLVRYVSTGTSPLLGQWGPRTACNLIAKPGRDLWHVQIKRVGGMLYGLLNDCVSGQNGAHGDLYLMKSTDGLKWDMSTKQLIPRAKLGEHTALYRACFVPGVKDGVFGLDIWYPGWIPGATPVWNIFKTFACYDSGWLPLSLGVGWDALTGHAPRARVLNGLLMVEGAVSRKTTAADFGALATMPSSLPLQGTKTTFAGAHVAKKGSSLSPTEIYVAFDTGLIRCVDYTGMDTSVGWVLPIGFTVPADQR